MSGGVKRAQCPSCKQSFSYPVGSAPSACPSCGYAPGQRTRAPPAAQAQPTAQAQQVAVPPKKMGPVRKTLFILGGFVLLIGLVVAVMPDDEANAPSTSTSGDGAETQSGSTGDDDDTDPAPDPEPEPEPEPEAGFGNGQHRVGTDIEPGLYRTSGSSGCYWERLSGFSGDFDDIEANKVSSHPMIVEILDRDEGFNSERCARWIPLEEHLNETEENTPYSVIEPGHYVVGDEIPAGEWRAEGGDNCYWERLSGFTGDFDDIESNGNPSGQVIVDIQDTDAGFWSSGCGSWEYLG